MILYAHGILPTESIQLGDILHVSAVTAANAAKDIRENIRNLTGGNMTHYEVLMDKAVARAFDLLKQRATEAGYDGVVGVTLSHPSVVSGGVEVVVYGNGFRYA
ncbi:MAG: heavy metal-binding domain-containing protein [Deinococcota bacterium]